MDAYLPLVYGYAGERCHRIAKPSLYILSTDVPTYLSRYLPTCIRTRLYPGLGHVPEDVGMINKGDGHGNNKGRAERCAILGPGAFCQICMVGWSGIPRTFGDPRETRKQKDGLDSVREGRVLEVVWNSVWNVGRYRHGMWVDLSGPSSSRTGEFPLASPRRRPTCLGGLPWGGDSRLEKVWHRRP